MTEHEIRRMVVRLIGDGSAYFSMLEKADKETAKTRSTVERYAKQIEGFGNSLSKFGGKVAGVGAKMSMAITAPLTALNALAIKAGADFESGFAGVRKTVDATEEQFAMLKQGFKDMAMTTPVAVEELLRIGEAAGQLGIKTDAILDFTKTIAMLNVATNLGEEGATDMAKFANIIGMSQDKFQNLGSALVDLGNKLPTTEKDIMNMSMRLAGMGKTLGFSVPQVTGLAAALSSVGLEAEMGGSAMSTFMLGMATDVAQNTKQLGAMAKVAGVTTDQFKESFRKDALGALMMLLSGLNKLEGEAKIVALREMGVDGIRMSDALQRASGAVDLLKESLQTSEKAFNENKALTKEAGERFKTFWSQVELLKNQLKDLMTDAFDLMRPSLNALITKSKEIIAWFKSWSNESKIMAINILKVVAVLGPLLTGLGTLIMFMGAVISAGGVIIGVLGAITVPMWAVVAAVSALIAGLAAVTYWLIGPDGISNAFQIALARVQNFVNLAVAFMQNFGQNIRILKDWLLANWKQLVGDMSSLWGTMVGNMISNFVVTIATIPRVMAVIAGWLTGLWRRIFSVDFLYWIVQGIKQGLLLIQDFAQKAVQAIKDVLRGEGIDFGEYIAKLEGDFKKGAEDINPLDALQTVLKEQLGQIQSPLAGFQMSTPLPELALGQMAEVPRNALADQSIVGALNTPLQASLQPGSPQMQAVDALKDRAVAKTNQTLESIKLGIDKLVENSTQQLQNPTLELDALGLTE